jgi:SNF2 family DNA or RNA helicase
MNYKRILYALFPEKHLGLVPKCVIVYSDKEGILQLDYTQITNKNKQKYDYLFDEKDKFLLNYCLQLEPEIIVKKIKDTTNNNWDAFAKKYITEAKIHNTPDSYAKYIQDYINGFQNKFYENIGDKALFLKKGEIPSVWQQIYFEEGVPEVYYHFNYEKFIHYYLDILLDNKEIELIGTNLLSTQPARILRRRKIITFDKEINGNTLKPFFNNEIIEVPYQKTEEYFNNFIKTLVNNRKKIITNGFEIEDLYNELNAVLEVNLENKNQQTNIFGEEEVNDENQVFWFSFFFEYGNFRFQSGHNASTVKLEQFENKYIFTRIERKTSEENTILEEINKLGLNLKTRSQSLSFDQGITWINNNHQALQNLGIEIRQKAKAIANRKYFIGNISIDAQAIETIDWFEIKGVVKFGEYKFRLIDIIKLIRKNKREILLPNGEFARFPEAWIDEYYYLSTYSIYDNERILTAKHHVVLLNELKNKGSLKLNIKSKLKTIFNSKPIEQYELPKGFKGELRHYQHEGYNWLRFLEELKLGGCLADDMGLGKTIQTLCLLQWLKETKTGNSLLVVPKSLIYNWKNEAERFCPDLKILTHSGHQRSKDTKEFTEYDIILTSYAIMRSDIDILRKFAFNYCILDESQYIKNYRSETAKACLELNAKNFLSLTGTPIENSITDLWTQMNFLNRNILGNINFFIKEFNSEEKIKTLQKMIKPFIIRRLKSKVAKELPEKNINIQYCEMTEEQREIYNNTKNEYRTLILKDSKEKVTGKTFNLLEGLLRMRQNANHPVIADSNYTESSGKFENATQLLDTIIESGSKVLIFSSFTKHLQLFKDYLDNQNKAYCYLDGKTKNREEQVDLFQNNPSIQVFLISLKAGGVGLNLTAAEYVFLLDPWWNPAAEAQAFDRTHRIGQKKNVFIYKFITKASIEEKIMLLQEKKSKLAEELITAEEGFVKSLNKEEIEYLLN